MTISLFSLPLFFLSQSLCPSDMSIIGPVFFFHMGSSTSSSARHAPLSLYPFLGLGDVIVDCHPPLSPVELGYVCKPSTLFCPLPHGIRVRISALVYSSVPFSYDVVSFGLLILGKFVTLTTCRTLLWLNTASMNLVAPLNDYVKPLLKH